MYSSRNDPLFRSGFSRQYPSFSLSCLLQSSLDSVLLQHELTCHCLIRGLPGYPQSCVHCTYTGRKARFWDRFRGRYSNSHLPSSCCPIFRKTWTNTSRPKASHTMLCLQSFHNSSRTQNADSKSRSHFDPFRPTANSHLSHSHDLAIYSTYKKLEARFTAQRDNLKSKIPEIETTLFSVEHIKATVRTPPPMT